MTIKVELSTPAYWVTFGAFPETSPLLMSLKRIGEGAAPLEKARETVALIFRKTLDELVAEKQIVPQMFARRRAQEAEAESAGDAPVDDGRRDSPGTPA